MRVSGCLCGACGRPGHIPGDGKCIQHQSVAGAEPDVIRTTGQTVAAAKRRAARRKDGAALRASRQLAEAQTEPASGAPTEAASTPPVAVQGATAASRFTAAVRAFRSGSGATDHSGTATPTTSQDEPVTTLSAAAQAIASSAIEALRAKRLSQSLPSPLDVLAQRARRKSMLSSRGSSRGSARKLFASAVADTMAANRNASTAASAADSPASRLSLSGSPLMDSGTTTPTPRRKHRKSIFQRQQELCRQPSVASPLALVGEHLTPAQMEEAVTQHLVEAMRDDPVDSPAAAAKPVAPTTRHSPRGVTTADTPGTPDKRDTPLAAPVPPLVNSATPGDGVQSPHVGATPTSLPSLGDVVSPAAPAAGDTGIVGITAVHVESDSDTDDEAEQGSVPAQASDGVDTASSTGLSKSSSWLRDSSLQPPAITTSLPRRVDGGATTGSTPVVSHHDEQDSHSHASTLDDVWKQVGGITTPVATAGAASTAGASVPHQEPHRPPTARTPVYTGGKSSQLRRPSTTGALLASSGPSPRRAQYPTTTTAPPAGASNAASGVSSGSTSPFAADPYHSHRLALPALNAASAVHHKRKHLFTAFSMGALTDDLMLQSAGQVLYAADQRRKAAALAVRGLPVPRELRPFSPAGTPSASRLPSPRRSPRLRPGMAASFHTPPSSRRKKPLPARRIQSYHGMPRERKRQLLAKMASVGTAMSGFSLRHRRQRSSGDAQDGGRLSASTVSNPSRASPSTIEALTHVDPDELVLRHVLTKVMPDRTRALGLWDVALGSGMQAQSQDASPFGSPRYGTVLERVCVCECGCGCAVTRVCRESCSRPSSAFSSQAGSPTHRDSRGAESPATASTLRQRITNALHRASSRSSVASNISHSVGGDNASVDSASGSPSRRSVQWHDHSSLAGDGTPDRNTSPSFRGSPVKAARFVSTPVMAHGSASTLLPALAETPLDTRARPVPLSDGEVLKPTPRHPANHASFWSDHTSVASPASPTHTHKPSLDHPRAPQPFYSYDHAASHNFGSFRLPVTRALTSASTGHGGLAMDSLESAGTAALAMDLADTVDSGVRAVVQPSAPTSRTLLHANAMPPPSLRSPRLKFLKLRTPAYLTSPRSNAGHGHSDTSAHHQESQESSLSAGAVRCCVCAPAPVYRPW